MRFHIVPMPDKTAMNISNFLISRRKIIVKSTTAAYLDPKAWNIQSSEDRRPVNTCISRS